VWSPTQTRALDLKAGPRGEGSFAPGQWVDCEYKEKPRRGGSPKFFCEIAPGDEVKVKYGPRNGEVFGEVLATRLFWALGFMVDRMYPVRVRCRGCPADPFNEPKPDPGAVRVFDPAVIERKLPGRSLESEVDSGWSWKELELIGPEAGPQARAQRDALKLLATFVQHTDNKPPQQRLVCPAGQDAGNNGCRQPILAIADLGLTFGSGNVFNANEKGSVNFKRWEETPVWKDPARCVARLRESYTGELEDPLISEAGRKFLAGLLLQLSDQQLRDLFDVARVELREREPPRPGPGASVEEWMSVFKRKRSEIADHRCPG
jgi:hypothetical protein